MMQNIVIGLILFLSTIMQISFLPVFFTDRSVPDVTLVIIMIWIARADFNSVLKWTIIGGLMADIASFQPVGLNVFAFVTVAFIINSLSKRFLVPQFAGKFFILIILVVVGTAVNQAIIGFAAGIGGQTAGLFRSIPFFFGQGFFLKLLYNLGIFAILYWPLKKLDKIFAYQNNRVIIKR
ncbi:MAG: rod shape-determining protein MreD [Candidatus Moranbacteria bacterium]|nr:rod shape-determining protein MreD [Candidatus Moranbacteria bacterium]